ncbi:ABC transporter permease [Telmatospirillum sp.]|uniref:ABC transporter permease n=1 Tax=Telmatospirillum sp. TaxID=2079197 RepID=UPI0028517C82|nr:ABC transporter permease [Telmatospirillum sp.]MDR3439661.1 ABC transporter permease [Telmatospirillum sp.]
MNVGTWRMGRGTNTLAFVLAAPAVVVFGAFWLLPMARLAVFAAGGQLGWAAYLAVVTHPRYLESLISTVVLSAAVTAATLAIGGIAGVFLSRHRFPGHGLLVGMLTLPMAFPGVVVGFLVILLAGRQGLIGLLAQALGAGKLVFAYSMTGLFLGYLYFSIPRVLLTIMAAAEKLDPALEEAARSLGASPRQILQDVLIPGLKPALISAGALCFATSMGAFGTAFTLATRISVLPMTIYTEFTLFADMAIAAAMSLVLGAVTWLVLALARNATGAGVAAAA